MTLYTQATALTNYGDPFPNGIGTPPAVPPDTEWSERFFAPRPDMPVLIASKGYDWRNSIIAAPHYYLDGDVWRDTLTGAPA